MINIAETFGNRLKSIRNELGISQEQIARLLHCNCSAYSYYELGRTEPSLEKLIRLADIFGLSVDVLLGHEITGTVGETVNPDKKTFW